ncbi:PREDICTED: uncharacterized protein LOC108575165 [Habropoda laboriosa]|uniref:uncharacterized protein LOC108575165 n=1 Tax=Habropoda laboriosa TaxID=597456 RepID=UPI00083DBA14|nr:PREDICTED: uncharacterized protein LOC108575165 [Habropoda laboriosa]
MTSVLHEEESKVTRMKQKLMNDTHVKEETRSFLSFSRENLSISQSDLEQGFNKHRFRPNRNTIISVTALLIALLCLGLESWKFHYSLVNAREIEELKRNVESLKHRFLEEDLLDELKAFEEQLYAEESNDDDDDPGEADIDTTDYDSNYDDDTSSHDYLTDYHSPPTFGARPSEFPDTSSTIAPVPSPPELSSDKATIELWAAMRKLEAKHGQELKKIHKNLDRDRDRDHEKKVLEEKLDDQKNNTKWKRDVPDVESTRDLLLNWKIALKRKRSIGKEEHGSERLYINRHHPKNYTRRMTASDSNSKEMWEDKSFQQDKNKSIVVTNRYPPKKYNTHQAVDANHAPPSKRRGESSVQSGSTRSRKSSRKHRSAHHTTFAVHYDGNKDWRSHNDKNTGNGRILHGDSVFKAWKASSWVETIGMNKYFHMSNNGSVTVYEPGLYLVYAQIHYRDEHDELGFHLQVNNQSILQCVVDNSCNSRNISQTCFSAQLTSLKKQDVLVFKEAQASRYAIFDKENSFFGMVKLADICT